MELVVVVLILAVLGAIAVPRLARSNGEARVNSFASTLRAFGDAAAMFNATTGGWPANAETGTPPGELEALIDSVAWARATPFGGRWDIETNASGVGCAVGVVFASAVGSDRLALLRGVDELIDDGNLAVGRFRELSSGRYALVLEPGIGATVVTQTELDARIDAGGGSGTLDMLRGRD